MRILGMVGVPLDTVLLGLAALAVVIIALVKFLNKK